MNKLISMLALALLPLGAPAAAPGLDCGAISHGEILRKTEALIVSRSPVDEVMGEMPTVQGTQECARLEFSIDAVGSPLDVKIVEASGNMAFSLAAIRAVKKYKFKPEFLSRYRTYSVIVRGVADRMTPEYLEGVDVKK